MRIPACILVLLFLGATASDHSFAQILEWARSTTGDNDGYGSAEDVGVDDSGNVYTTGFFLLDTDFDDDGIADVTDIGFGDIYVAKYNNTGVLQWVIAAGGAGIDQGRGIAVDGEGNSYVTGFIEADADFDGDGETDAVLTGVINLFLAKYSSDGVLQWVNNVCGLGEDVVIDNSGGVIITGLLSYCADFDGDGNADVTSSGPFVAKYSVDGDFQWFRFADGGISETGTGVGVDTAGSVYYTGGFFGSPDFNGDQIPDVVSTVSASMFLAKYDSDGEFQWVKAAGSSLQDARGSAISVSPGGGAFVSGSFQGAADFSGDGTPDVFDTFFGKAFVVRYDSDGMFQWVRSLGGQFPYDALSVSASENDVFIAGYFDGPADFDGDGTNDIVGTILARYRTTGMPLEALAGSGSNPDGIRGMTRDTEGDLYVAGVYSGSADIDGDSTLDVGSKRAFEPFVAKFAVDGSIGVDPDRSALRADLLMLGQNYPNPFNSSTTIKYVVLEAGPVTLSVYDLLGRKVETIIDQYLPAGQYEREWTADKNWGKANSSELLFYRLTVGRLSTSRSMLLVR